MFAMRKIDKQVRDKEGIPRISGQDSRTGETTDTMSVNRAEGTAVRVVLEVFGGSAFFSRKQRQKDNTQRRV